MPINNLNPIAIVGRIFRALFPSDKGSSAAEVTSLDRRGVYQWLWNIYTNQQYMRTALGGSLEIISEQLGEARAQDIVGMINPVEQVVELYAQNTFAGNFGEEIVVAEKIGTKRKERAVNPDILDPLEKIWEWSNVNREKDRYARLAALFGTCGIRVVAKVGKNYPEDGVSERRVYLQFENPALIDDYSSDERGNIDQILTIHRVLEGDISLDQNNDDREYHVYKYLLNKTEFKATRDDVPYDVVVDEDTGEFTNIKNLFGFVPYVINFFRKHDQRWGAWAFMGSEIPIDKINALSAHIFRQIFRHLNVTWVVTGNGAAPTEFNFSGNRVIYIERKLSENAADTTMEPMISDLSISEAATFLKDNVTALADRLPELKATMGEFLANQSGETVAELRKPAEDKLMVYRANAEGDLIKAQKMALSYGILLGLWDCGTGIGTIEAANKAFRSGKLDHKFNVRDALSTTKAEKTANELSTIELDQAKADLESSKQQSAFDQTIGDKKVLPKQTSKPKLSSAQAA